MNISSARLPVLLLALAAAACSPTARRRRWRRRLRQLRSPGGDLVITEVMSTRPDKPGQILRGLQRQPPDHRRQRADPVLQPGRGVERGDPTRWRRLSIEPGPYSRWAPPIPRRCRVHRLRLRQRAARCATAARSWPCAAATRHRPRTSTPAPRRDGVAWSLDGPSRPDQCANDEPGTSAPPPPSSPRACSAPRAPPTSRARPRPSPCSCTGEDGDATWSARSWVTSSSASTWLVRTVRRRAGMVRGLRGDRRRP